MSWPRKIPSPEAFYIILLLILSKNSKFGVVKRACPEIFLGLCFVLRVNGNLTCFKGLKPTQMNYLTSNTEH